MTSGYIMTSAVQMFPRWALTLCFHELAIVHRYIREQNIIFRQIIASFDQELTVLKILQDSPDQIWSFLLPDLGFTDL